MDVSSLDFIHYTDYELTIVRLVMRTFHWGLVFLIVGFCAAHWWRKEKSPSLRTLLVVFLFSVALIWGASDAFDAFAGSRVFTPDGYGRTLGPYATAVDEELYSYYMDVAINDTGNALQPLGATIVTTLTLIMGQVLGVALHLARRVYRTI